MKEANEKTLYQLTDRYEKDSFYVEWNKLPMEVISYLASEGCLYDILRYSTVKESLEEVTVAYFKKVKRFKKGMTTMGFGDIIYGI